jgi:YD repeat-containing protein
VPTAVSAWRRSGSHDPEYPDNLPAGPLVRYEYTPRGELAAVYDRDGMQVRSFTYDAKNPGRMTAHSHAGRPQTTYHYDEAGRVVAQHNPEGLSYRYGYENNTVTITDSLNRREVLHTEGEGGLKRVVKQEQADGSAFSENSTTRAACWRRPMRPDAGRSTG